MTEEKIKELQTLRRSGLDWNTIAARLGIPKSTCKHRWWALTAPEEKQRERQDRKNAKYRTWYAQRGLKRIPPRQPEALVVPDSVLAEREATWTEPRSITAWMCGDPVPSRSALAQREVRA